MEVRWTALSSVEARGHITHYTISYWPASNSEPVTSITVHNTTSISYRVLIGGLLSGEAYVVEVSASTAAGDGDKTEVTLSTGARGIYSDGVMYVIERSYYNYAALMAGGIILFCSPCSILPYCCHHWRSCGRFCHHCYKQKRVSYTLVLS